MANANCYFSLWSTIDSKALKHKEEGFYHLEKEPAGKQASKNAEKVQCC